MYIFIAVLVVIASLNVFATQQPEPQFQSEANYVRIDVRVTDQEGNFVSDLTKEDFEIFENGKKQNIETFELLNRYPNPSQRVHDAINSRLFVIFLDDYHIHARFSSRVRGIVEDFIAKLNPNDFVALMGPATLIENVVPTNNHAEILAQVSKFQGVQYNYTPRNSFEANYANATQKQKEIIRNGVSLSALNGLAIWLGAMREEHKAIILISDGFPANLSQYNNFRDEINTPDGGIAERSSPPSLGFPFPNTEDNYIYQDLLKEINDVIEAANTWNTSIYAISFQGHNQTLTRYNPASTLQYLTSGTQGRVFQRANQAINSILEETKDYYLLGYRSNQDIRKEEDYFQKVRVKLKRKNLKLFARKGYWVDAKVSARKKEVVVSLSEKAKKAFSYLARNTAELMRTHFSISREESGTSSNLVLAIEPAKSGSLLVNYRFFEENQEAEIFINVEDNDNGHIYLSGKVGEGNIHQGRHLFTAWGKLPVSPGNLQVETTVKNRGVLLYRRTDNIEVSDFKDTNLSIGLPTIYRSSTHHFLTKILQGEGIPTAASRFLRRETLVMDFDVSISEECRDNVSTQLLNSNEEEIISIKSEKIGKYAYRAMLPLSSFAPRQQYMVRFSAFCEELKEENFWAFNLR